MSARWPSDLLAEVLERQPQDVSRLLLRTSILERVSGPLADRLTGCSGSERILWELEDAGAFVVSLGAERSWFRYHHLFADLLALELRRTAPRELPALHTIAAEWLAEHGYPVDAIRHAQAAEDWDLATRLLADNCLSMYGTEIELHSIDIWRVSDGQLIEHWDELNTLEFFQQIGAVPAFAPA